MVSFALDSVHIVIFDYPKYPWGFLVFSFIGITKSTWSMNIV